MAHDERLHGHVAVLKILLGSYLDHLARSWHGTSDAATSVAAVLDAVGRTIEVQPADQKRVNSAVAKLRRIHHGPLARLSKHLELTLGEEIIIAAAWWTDLDPQLGSVFGVLHDDGHRRNPTSGLLHLVTEPFNIALPVHPRRLIQQGVITSMGPSAGIELSTVVRELLDESLPKAQIEGVYNALPERLKAFVEPVATLATSPGGPLVLRGVPGSGRRVLASAVAQHLGQPLLDVDRPDEELRLLARLGFGIALVDSARAATMVWDESAGPLFVLGLPEDDPSSLRVVEVPLPSFVERKQAWSTAAKGLGIKERGLSERLAEQFRFTERDIVQAAERVRLAIAVAGEPATTRDLWTAAQRQPDLDLSRVATRIEPSFTFDDMVLTPEVASRLHELVTHVRFRQTVLDRWGFRARMPRGQGVAALFSGPPGTGKTTAAEAIANELDTDLFRIDLSRVVSKYIGETEKNLAIAFREAERSGAVLLFDEADALFGKRTDVRDSHDRYANLEVSYLLQRVETFSGLVLLSTNKIGNIDEAFQRRLRFVVRFDSPSADERARLWERSFPEDALVGELDWAHLASHELTGGHIQTAALSAAFLAASDGGIIDNEHLARAISHEYEKLNRAAPGLRGVS